MNLEEQIKQMVKEEIDRVLSNLTINIKLEYNKKVATLEGSVDVAKGAVSLRAQTCPTNIQDATRGDARAVRRVGHTEQANVNVDDPEHLSMAGKNKEIITDEDKHNISNIFGMPIDVVEALTGISLDNKSHELIENPTDEDFAKRGIELPETIKEAMRAKGIEIKERNA